MYGPECGDPGIIQLFGPDYGQLEIIDRLDLYTLNIWLVISHAADACDG